MIIGSSYLLRKKPEPEPQIDNLESRASELWEFLCQEPSVFNSRKRNTANELLEDYEISDPDDLAFLFKNKEKTLAFFNALEPLFLQKKVGLFKKGYSNFIIPLLPSKEEEEDDPNKVSANLMVQLDSAVDQNAPASPKPSSPPTDLATPRTSLVLPSPSAMVSSELDLLKDEVAALRSASLATPSTPDPVILQMLAGVQESLKAQKIQRDEDAKTFQALLTKVGKQEQPSANQSKEVDALRAEQQHALEKENLQRMLDAKTKEAFEAQLAAKDAQIMALTAAKPGKSCVEDDEGGDGEDEDDDEEDDDALSALTHGSKGSKGPKDPKKKSNPKTTAKDIRDAVVKEIKDHIDGQLGFIPPEVMSKKLNSPEGLLLIPSWCKCTSVTCDHVGDED